MIKILESLNNNENILDEGIIDIVGKIKSWFEKNKTNKEIRNIQTEIENEGGDISAFFNKLVPSQGKADTKAGELIRAMMRLLYRDFNDGDRYYEGYGLETCGPSAIFLIQKGIDSLADFAKYQYEQDIDVSDSEYTNFLNSVSEEVIEHIKENPSLLIEPNNEDCLRTDISDLAEYERKYEFDVEFNEAVQRHLDNGDIDLGDVEEEISTWECCDDIEIEYGGIVITNLSKEDYNYISDNIWNWMDVYGESLDDEFGDEYEYDDYEEGLNVDLFENLSLLDENE